MTSPETTPPKNTFSENYRYNKLCSFSGLTGKYPIRNPTVYLGVEVEAENVSRQAIDRNVPSSWTRVQDGSLKVEGMEFVTVPIPFRFLEIELERLFSGIKPTFSCRTSIHVHMNARDFTQEELVKFLILYTIFERSLYKFSGGRDDNIYCVPLYQYDSYLQSVLTRCKNGEFPREWSKYHGLNLVPLWGQEGSSNRIGTIEFRHMKGTKDVKYIIDWCNLITCLKFAAKSNDINNILKYITGDEKNNLEFTKHIFQEWGGLISNQSSFKDDVNEGLLYIKYILEKSNWLVNSYKIQRVTLPFETNELEERPQMTLYSSGVIRRGYRPDSPLASMEMPSLNTRPTYILDDSPERSAF